MCPTLSGAGDFHPFLYIPLLTLPLAAFCLIGLYRLVPFISTRIASCARLLFNVETLRRVASRRPVQIMMFLLFFTLAVYCFTLEIVEMLERRKSTRERERLAQQEELINAALKAGGGCEYCMNSRVWRSRILQQMAAGGGGRGGSDGMRWQS